MPVPEDMRRTVRVQLRLRPDAAAVLDGVPEGYRSSWVSALILRAAKSIADHNWTSPRKLGGKSS